MTTKTREIAKILRLTLHREYLAAIASGKKRTEYRKAKPYWRTLLEGRDYDMVLFRNGYGRNAPEMLVEFRGVRRDGKGRNADYAIRLGRILKVKRSKDGPRTAERAAKKP